jgi:hypothetical protein
MTDVVVFKYPDNFDIHTEDKRACSGYSADTFFKSLELLLRAYEERTKTNFRHDLYEDYKKGYRSLMPVFLLRFPSDSE